MVLGSGRYVVSRFAWALGFNVIGNEQSETKETLLLRFG